MGAIVFIVILLIAIVVGGIYGTRAIQQNQGYYAIGGPNGSNAKSYMKQNPLMKKVFDFVEEHNNNNVWSEEQIKEQFKMGAKAVISHYDKVKIVIMQNAAIAFGEPDYNNAANGTKGQIFFKKEIFLSSIREKDISMATSSYTIQEPEKKSVVGSAVAGTIIAGGVGAVVGAVSAASHNIAESNKEIKKPIFVSSGKKCAEFMFYPTGSNKLQLREIRVAEDIDLADCIRYSDGTKSSVNIQMKEAIGIIIEQLWKE